MEPLEQLEKSSTVGSVGDTRVKRKKLKGKRAVVKWLKFFRWKKKKEYERLTVEEKVLYKLRKVMSTSLSLLFFLLFSPFDCSRE